MEIPRGGDQREVMTCAKALGQEPSVCREWSEGLVEGSVGQSGEGIRSQCMQVTEWDGAWR